MPGLFDVEAWFARIGWRGDRKPSFETLTGLLQAQLAAIPFENIDILLGRHISLLPEKLQEKLVRNRRGGQCIEQCSLFLGMLDALGFQVRGHLGRAVMFGADERVHMFLTVNFGGKIFVVDPGLGRFSSPTPVPLVDDRIPASVNANHRMSREANHWVLNVRRGSEFIPGWITTFDEDRPIDFRVANHWLNTYPGSRLKNSLVLTAVTRDGYISVIDRKVSVVRGEDTAAWQLADRRELRSLLSKHFGFDLAEVEQMRVPAIPEW